MEPYDGISGTTTILEDVSEVGCDQNEAVINSEAILNEFLTYVENNLAPSKVTSTQNCVDLENKDIQNVLSVDRALKEAGQYVNNNESTLRGDLTSLYFNNIRAQVFSDPLHVAGFYNNEPVIFSRAAEFAQSENMVMSIDNETGSVNPDLSSESSKLIDPFEDFFQKVFNDSDCWQPYDEYNMDVLNNILNCLNPVFFKPTDVVSTRNEVHSPLEVSYGTVNIQIDTKTTNFKRIWA